MYPVEGVVHRHPHPDRPAGILVGDGAGHGRFRRVGRTSVEGDVHRGRGLVEHDAVGNGYGHYVPVVQEADVDGLHAVPLIEDPHDLLLHRVPFGILEGRFVGDLHQAEPGRVRRVDGETDHGMARPVRAILDDHRSDRLGYVQLDAIGVQVGVAGRVGDPDIDVAFAVVALGQPPVVDLGDAFGHFP